MFKNLFKNYDEFLAFLTVVSSSNNHNSFMKNYLHLLDFKQGMMLNMNMMTTLSGRFRIDFLLLEKKTLIITG